MTDARRRTRFPQETKPRRFVTEIFFADDFKCHGASQIDVKRLVSDTHRTATQLDRFSIFVQHQFIMLESMRYARGFYLSVVWFSRLVGLDSAIQSLAKHAHRTEFHCSRKLITATRADASVLHCRTMVAFHEMGLLPTIACKSMFRNKIPETPHRRLCNGMKSNISNHDYELHLGGTAKPGIQKTLGAAVISGTCVVAHDSAATWMMNIFTGSPSLFRSCQPWHHCLSFCSHCPPVPSPIGSIVRNWSARSMFAWPPQPSL